MQMMQLICPQCRADLSVDKDMKQAFCMYCGNKIIICNENEYIYRSVDEARLLEAQNERIKLEFEMEQRKNQESEKRTRRRNEKMRKSFIIAGGVLAFSALFLVLPLTAISFSFLGVAALVFLAGTVLALIGFIYGLLND